MKRVDIIGSVSVGSFDNFYPMIVSDNGCPCTVKGEFLSYDCNNWRWIIAGGRGGKYGVVSVYWLTLLADSIDSTGSFQQLLSMQVMNEKNTT